MRPLALALSPITQHCSCNKLPEKQLKNQFDEMQQ